MKQRGIEEWEIEYIIKHPNYTKKSFDGRKIAIGKVKDRIIKIIYLSEESYIKLNKCDVFMKFEYDKEADAAYIYLEDSIAEDQSQKTIE